MPLVSQLGLIFRASVLNQLSAKVQLVRKDYSHARMTAALRTINNREVKLVNRVLSGRMTLHQLEEKAWKLAPYKVMLDEASSAATPASTPAAARPVDTVAAFRGVLIRTQCSLDPNAHVSSSLKDQLAVMLDPVSLHSLARHKLAEAFWAGHLGDEVALRQQVGAQARNEVGQVMATREDCLRREREAALDIVACIAAREPLHEDSRSRALSIMLSRLIPYSSDEPRAGPRVHSQTPVQGAPRDYVVPPSWTKVALAFWQHAWPNSTEFQAAFVEAREQNIAPDARDPYPAQTRCRLTFEFIEYIRAHRREDPHSGGQPEPSVLDAFTEKLQREAVDDVLAERVCAGPGTGPARPLATKPDVPPHEPDNSDQWSDGESDAGSVLI